MHPHRRSDLLAVWRKVDCKDGTSVSARCFRGQLYDSVTCLSVINKHLAVRTDRNEVFTIGCVSDVLNEASVGVDGLVVFVGCSVVEDEVVVVTCSNSTERSVFANSHGIDLSTVTRHLTYTRTCVERECVTKSLPSITYSNDTLRLAIPSKIVDSTSNDLDFALDDLLISYKIPYSNISGCIGRSAVVSGRRDACYGGRLSVLRVSQRWLGRVGDGTNKDGSVLTVNDLFARGIRRDLCGLRTSGGRIAWKQVESVADILLSDG